MESTRTINAIVCSGMLASPGGIGAGMYSYKIGYSRGGQHVVTRAFHRESSQGVNGQEVTGSFVTRSMYLLQGITGMLGGKIKDWPRPSSLDAH